MTQRTGSRPAGVMTWGLLVLAAAFTTFANAEETPTAGSYGVNPGDKLEVVVWKEEDLQRVVIVRPDGYFSFPLTGDIKAQGRTIEAISQDLTLRLSRYIPDPVVSVAVNETGGSRVYVIGQVNRPGEFPVNRYVDVMQALAMAGGTTPFAQVNDILILRRDGSTQSALRFAYGDVSSGKKLQQNVVLVPGDTVVVP